MATSPGQPPAFCNAMQMIDAQMAISLRLSPNDKFDTALKSKTYMHIDIKIEVNSERHGHHKAERRAEEICGEQSFNATGRSASPN
ncbi:hypothetical protein AAF712_004110 [Marasmius tenuissimus]|uniref:Uncharacterized protein n=1 Tax=Marasmius tenuissimus TaxID=585030 RepID=A0ABR3A466_9AGAR|nr:hypothetical protein PM082_001644 [Marasmius tenuissimus]